MKPKQFGIGNSFEESEYNSSLEMPLNSGKDVTYQQEHQHETKSPFHYNKTAFIFTFVVLAFIVLVGLSTLIFSGLNSKNSGTGSTNAQKIANYGVSNLPLNKISNNQQLQIGTANLAINGQLQVNKTLVLTPGNVPTSKTTGQIYYDQSTNQPYYYNGSQFISLASNALPHVTSVGGATGAIGLGNGLAIDSNNQLSLSTNFLQSVQPAVLTAGNGISVNGGSISNTGVVSLTASGGGLLITHDATGNYVITNTGSGSTVAGGDLTGNYPNPTVAKLQGTTLTISSISSGQVLQYNGSALINSLITNANLGTGNFGNITGVGVLTSGSIGGAFSTIANNYLTNNGSLNVTAGNGLTGGGSVALGGTDTLSVAYGNSANTAVQGNNTLICASGTGNLSGGGNTVTLGTSGSTCNSLTITATPTFTSLTVQGSNGITVGTAGSTEGQLTLYNISNGNKTILQSLAPNSQNQTVTIPATNNVGGNDTVCLLMLANCVGAGGGVTTSGGTQNFIPKYTNLAANQLGSSGISDDGTNVSIASEGFIANSVTTATLQSAGVMAITPGGALTIGVTNQKFTLQGNSASTITAGSGGNSTALVFAALSGANTITIPAATGTVCLENSVSCGFATSGAGVTSLNLLTGALTVANATTLGSTITINDTQANGLASGKGIAAFNSTNFTASSGIVNTIQGISTAATPQFAGLSLNGDLTLVAGATIHADVLSATALGTGLTLSGGANNITFSNSSGANTFLFPTTGGTGQVICTSGISCASGGGQAVILEPGSVQTANANKTSVFINKQSGSGNLIELQAAGSDAFVINNAGTTTVSGLANLNGGAIVTGTLGVNTITPSAALVVGATTQQFTLQGNSSSAIAITGGGFTTSVGFNIGNGGTAPNGGVTYQFLNDNTVAAGTYTVCTTAGNCVGTGGSLTGSGTAGTIGKFTSGSNISNSIITDNGTTVTVGGNLAVGISGASQLSIGVGSTADGTLAFYNSTNNNKITLSVAAAPAGAVSLKLPNASGTFAVSASGPLALDATTGALSCATCLTSGGGAGGGVSSITGTAGGSSAINGALTLNNALTSGTTITVNDAQANGLASGKGIAAFNSTNFTASSGIVNTIQDIATGSSPTFSNLALQGATGLTLGNTSGNTGQVVFLDGSNDGFTNTFSQATLHANRTITVPDNGGTLAVAVGGSNLALSGGGVLSFSNSPSFSGTLGVTGVTTLSSQLNANGGIVTNNTNINAGTGTITSGNINGQTISASSTFTGTVNIQGSSPLVLGLTGTNTGSIGFKGSTAASGVLTIQGPANPSTNNYVLSIPNISANANICTDNSVCTGYAPVSPSGNYIQLQTSTPGTAQTGHLNITGTAIVGALSVTNAATIGNGLTLTSGDLVVTGGNLTTNGTQRLSNAGALSNITGYTQTSGNFDQSGSGGTFATGTGTVNLNGNTSVTGSNTLTVGTGATVLGGTLAVTGTTTLTGQLNANGGIVTNNANINAGTGTITSGNINGQTISSAANLTGTLAIQGNNSLVLGTASTNDGSILFYDSTNNKTLTVSEAAAPASNISLLLPNQSGTFAVSATGPLTLNTTTGALSCSTCLTSGGGGSGGVSSIIGTDGGAVAINGALTLNNSGTSGTTITIDNALADGSTKGIAAFNSTNFTSASGVINTIQNINNTATPTFNALTLQGSGTNTLAVTGTPLAGAGGASSSLAQLGPNAIASGNNTATTGGTYLGINEPSSGAGSAADFLDFQNNGTKELVVTSGGAVTANGQLTVSSGGIAVTGNSTISGTLTSLTGLTSTGTVQGGIVNATTGFEIGGAATTGHYLRGNGTNYVDSVLLAGDISGTIFTLAASSGASQTVSSGATVSVLAGSSNNLTTTTSATDNVTVDIVSNPTFSGLLTASKSGANALAVTGTPLAGAGGATSSLVQFGSNAIASGNNTVATGGTYLGINEPSSGAGSTADFLNLQNNNTSELKVTSGGSVTEAGALTVSSGGIAVTGNSTINGTLTSLTGLTSSGNVTLSGIGGSGVVHSSAGGLLSSSAVVLGTDTSGSYVSALFGSGGAFTIANATSNGLGTITIDPASAIANGLLTTSSQTFAGGKTFNDNITLGNPSVTTGAIVFNGSGGTGTLTLQGPTIPNTSDYTLSIPTITANDTICTNGVLCSNYAPSTGGNYIAKNTNDTSSASYVGNLIGLTNTNTGAAGVLSLTNSGTNSALNILQSGTSEPSAGQALILANNNTTTPSGNLIDLQNKGISKFSVDSSGNVTDSGTYNTNTFTSSALAFGASSAATIQSAASQALTITANAASTWSTSAGNLTVQAAGTSTLALDTAGAGTVTVAATNATTLTLGNNTAATVTTIEGGTGAGAIALTPATAGTIVIGAAAGTGNITLGSSSAAESVLVGNGTGGSTVNIANGVATATGNTVNIAGDANTAGLTDTVNIATGNSVGAGANKVVNIANGTPGGTGTNTVSIGSLTNASTTTIQGGTGATALALTTGATAGTAGTIQIGNTTGANIQGINIGTNSTAASTNNVTIGSTIGGIATIQASGTAQTITGSSDTIKTSTNSTTAFQIQNTSGVNVLNADTTNQRVNIGLLSSPGTLNLVLAPTAPTVTPACSLNCNTSYSYEIVAYVGGGAGTTGGATTAASPAGSTTGGAVSAAVLSGANNNAISWSAPTNTNGAAVAYAVYRTVGGGTQGQGLIGTTTNTTFTDTGYFANPAPTPAGGGSLAANTYYYEVTALDSNGGETFESVGTNNEASITTTATLKTVTLSWANIAGARAYKVYRSTASGSEAFCSTTYTNSFNDTGTCTPSGSPPSTTTGYSNALAASGNGQLTVGSAGTPTSQLYVGGSVASAALGSVATGTNPLGIATQGNYTYVVNSANASSTLQIFNTAIPTNPVSVSTIKTGTNAGPWGIAIWGRYAYITNNSNGTLQVYDVNNPSAPYLVSSTATAAPNPYGIAVQGRYVYVGNTDSVAPDPVQIFDVSNPANPISVGSVAAGGGSYNIAVQGRYLYISNFNGAAFSIFDVSNPSTPVNASTNAPLTGGTHPYGIAVSGNYAYVAIFGSNLLDVYDVSNPYNPVGPIGIVATADTNPNAVVVQGRYAYVSEYNGGVGGVLQTFDISNPYDPVSVGSAPTANGAHGVSVSGRYAYVDNYAAGTLQTFDIGGAYTQQLQAGGTETGTLQVDTNETILGSSSIQGGVNIGQSAAIGGGLSVVGSATLGSVLSTADLQTPNSPSILNVGTAGATSYSYAIVAVNANGTTAASATATTTLGNATLSATNYNFLSWSPVAGATNYYVYRTAGGASQGKISIVAANTNPLVYKDTGAAGDSTTTPMIDTTGSLAVTGGVQGSLSIGGLSTSATPTVTTFGTGGAQTWGYEVVAVSSTGGVTAASAQGTTTGGTGNSTLTTSNYQRIAWTPVFGAVSYKIYRTQVAVTSPNPSTTGLIGTTSLNSFSDTGLAGDSTTPPSVNTTGSLSVSAGTYGTYGAAGSGTTITQSGTTITGSGTTFTSAMTGGTIYYNDGTTATLTYVSTTSLTSSVSKTISVAAPYNIVYGGFNVNSTGAVLLQPTTNSTTAFQVQNATGTTTVLDVDTSNGRVGIGTNAPGNPLSVGTLTTTDSVAQLAVSTGAVGNKGIVIQAVASQSADLLDVEDSGGNVLFGISKTGHVITGGGALPAAATQTNNGTTGTCTVAGDDTAGTVTITPGGTGIAAGLVCQVNFTTAFASAPRPVITPTSAVASAIQAYVSASATGNFQVSFNVAPAGASVYTFNWFSPQ